MTRVGSERHKKKLNAIIHNLQSAACHQTLQTDLLRTSKHFPSWLTSTCNIRTYNLEHKK